MHILICDINIKKQGHYIGYNQFILDTCRKIQSQNSSFQFSFLYNIEARDLLNILESDKIHYIDTKDAKTSKRMSNNNIFKCVVQKANTINIDKMLFMDFDKYQIPIFLTKFNFKISGILFRPHHRIKPSNSSFKTRFNSSINRTKKIIAELFLLFKKNISQIFILNDQEGVEQLNKYHNTDKFKYLPDPVFSYQSENYKSTIGIDKNERYKFLSFGALNERKNLTNILLAYNIAQFEHPTELVLVGPSTPEYIEYLEKTISQLTNINSNNKKITIKDTFVSDEDMDWIFSQSDAVLLIYKDFYGSSGLLGRACLHNIKVIGTNVGLLESMITSYNLGITCDANSVENIAKTLVKCKELTIPQESFQTFYKNHSPEKFIETLILKD